MRFIFALAGTLTLMTSSYGGAIISSLGSMGGLSDINDTTTIFEGFTMGAADFTLNSITVSLETVGISTFPTSVLLPSVYSGASAPTTLLENLVVAAGTILSFQTNDETFTPSSPLLLQAGNTYWFALVTTGIGNSGNLGWDGSAMPTGTFATYAGAAQGTLATAVQQNLFMSILVDGTAVTGSAVPEPGTFGMMGLSAVGLICIRRAARR